MADEPEARLYPRAFWSGTLTFGLVSVPVDLYPAVRSRRTPLRLLGPDEQPLARRYFCSADGEPLTNEDIVRGYENDDGSFTLVDDEELDALAPRKSRDIDLRRFVGRDEIPRQMLERPYVLAPAGESTKAYHLLAATMESSGRAGIATFVMRGKEYLAAIFAEGGTLRAVTMRFAAELRTPEDVGLPRAVRPAAERRQEVERAVAELTATSSTSWPCCANVWAPPAHRRERSVGAPRNASPRRALMTPTRSPTRARRSSTSRRKS
jgi:DNA end-binding protein Ku